MSYSTATLLLLATSVLVSSACFVHLWLRRAGFGRKLIWSFLVWVPFFGPLFYGAMFRLPSKQPPELQGGGSGNILG